MKILLAVAALGISFLVTGCGVKGRPLPPLEPVALGDGTLKPKKVPQKSKTSPTAPREEDSLRKGQSN